MRIWSLHPSLLDRRGLVACWRETLLAQKVLRELTKGYTNHPQLERFKATANPALSVARYLHGLADEADSRGYNFNRDRIAYNSDDIAPTADTCNNRPALLRTSFSRYKGGQTRSRVVVVHSQQLSPAH